MDKTPIVGQYLWTNDPVLMRGATLRSGLVTNVFSHFGKECVTLKIVNGMVCRLQVDSLQYDYNTRRNENETKTEKVVIKWLS